ncbi:MAG: murein L,D-transpeptidase [Verrucomicrobia bacterium]|nr:murein L,D-transpeptidase [Verrucomicrobiota bacterium]
MARIYTKFKTVPTPARLRKAGWWLLALAGLVLLGWLTWPTTKPPPSSQMVPPVTPSAKTNLLLVPAVRTNFIVTAPRSNAPINVAKSAQVSATFKIPPLPILPTPPLTPSVTAPTPPGQGVQTVLEAQVALATHGISAGSLDGVAGSQTRAALRAFQSREKIPVTGELDAATRARLSFTAPLYASYFISSNDLARLRPIASTWLGKSLQDRLDYETILELVAEKGHAHPDLVRRLNPEINWTNVIAGTLVKIPNAEYPPPKAKAAFVRIRLLDRTLEAFDANTNLLAHFPCSIARRVEKRPVGVLRVTVIARGPNYKFDPQNFPESTEARSLKRPLMLPAGPNNPVGTAWIGLDKPGYGIHGTPRPEDVGRTESHGCFRLANWNADFLVRLVNLGTPVYVEP